MARRKKPVLETVLVPVTEGSHLFVEWDEDAQNEFWNTPDYLPPMPGDGRNLVPTSERRELFLSIVAYATKAADQRPDLMNGHEKAALNRARSPADLHHALGLIEKVPDPELRDSLIHALFNAMESAMIVGSFRVQTHNQ